MSKRRQPPLSFIRTRQKMGTQMKYVLYGIAAIFFVGCFIGFGSSRFRGREEISRAPKLIAKIGKAEITRDAFEQRFHFDFDRYKQYQQAFNPQWNELEAREMVLGMVFDEMRDEILKNMAARREGVRVTQRDIRAKIEEQVQEALEAERKDLDPEEYRYLLHQRGSSLAKREQELRERIDPEKVRQELVFEKLEELVKNRVELTDEEVHARYDKVTARTIFIRANPGTDEADTRKKKEEARKKAEGLYQKLKGGADFAEVAKQESDDYTKGQGGDLGEFNRENHRFGEAFTKAVFNLKVGVISEPIETPEGYHLVQVQKKKIWPEDYDKADVRTLEDARKEAEEILQEVRKKGADFAALAEKYSEDEGSKEKGGDVGWVNKDTAFVKPFKDKALAMKPGEISEPVESPYGYHILKVEERRERPKEGERGKKKQGQDRPKEYEVKVRHILIKANDLRKRLLEEKQSQAWNDYLKKLREEAKKITIVYDPEVEAHLAQTDEPPRQEDAILAYRRALRYWPEEKPEIHYALAKLYEEKNRPFNQADGPARAAAARALGRLGAQEAVDPLLKALYDPSWEVKAGAAEALGQLKAETAVGPLQTLVRTERNEEVLEAAEKALKALGAEVPPRSHTPEPQKQRKPPAAPTKQKAGKTE